MEEDTARIIGGPNFKEKLHKQSSSREEMTLESLGLMSPKFGGQESNSSITMSANQIKEKESTNTLGSLLGASSGSGVLR